MRWSGSATIASNNTPRWALMRAMVCRPKRSVLYSKVPLRPSGRSSRKSDRSNLEVPRSTSNNVLRKPRSLNTSVEPPSVAARAALLAGEELAGEELAKSNITWNKGA